MPTINLIFIGEEFYWNSGTAMSSIYCADTGTRWDWGKVQLTLKEGKAISIRPANDAEMLQAHKKLLKFNPF